MILNLKSANSSTLDVTNIFANHQIYNRFCISNSCNSFSSQPQAYYTNRQVSIAKYFRDEQRSVGKIVETVVHFNPYRLLLSTGRFEYYALLLTRATVKRRAGRYHSRRLLTNETAVSSSSSDSSTACNNEHRRDATRMRRERGPIQPATIQLPPFDRIY